MENSPAQNRRLRAFFGIAELFCIWPGTSQASSLYPALAVYSKLLALIDKYIAPETSPASSPLTVLQAIAVLRQPRCTIRIDFELMGHGR